MIDPATQAVLQDIVRRESRSLLQYVRDAFPWTSAGEQEALTQLQMMIEEELKGTAAFSQFLSRHRSAPPYLGPYPMSFANINYVSLDHLLPLLVENERRAITDLERDLGRIADPAASAEVERIISMKQRHLKALEALAVARPEAVAH